MQQSLDTLTWVEMVLGLTNTLTIDSNIYKHAKVCDDDDVLNEEEDVYIIEGTVDHPITLAQLKDVFNKIQKQFKKVRQVADDRSYYYEGFSFLDNELSINWGS